MASSTMLSVSKAAFAKTYHTTGICKQHAAFFWRRFPHEYMPVYVDYGSNAVTDEDVRKDPDCRYIVHEGKRHPKIWADDPTTAKEIVFNNPNGVVKWHDVKTNTTKFLPVNRQSHLGDYKLCPTTGLPLNPLGPTGISGPGKLGRFGPNHAADPIVKRKKRENVWDVVLIRRKDTGEWAIPGGMVDPGELVTVTFKREFGEEAAAGGISPKLKECFTNAKEVYRGIVDDPRNTDNAWMETVAFAVDATDVAPKDLQLKSGSDAADVAWAEVELLANGRLLVTVRGNVVELYASHTDLVKAALLA